MVSLKIRDFSTRKMELIKKLQVEVLKQLWKKYRLTSIFESPDCLGLARFPGFLFQLFLNLL